VVLVGTWHLSMLEWFWWAPGIYLC